MDFVRRRRWHCKLARDKNDTTTTSMPPLLQMDLKVIFFRAWKALCSFFRVSRMFKITKLYTKPHGRKTYHTVKSRIREMPFSVPADFVFIYIGIFWQNQPEDVLKIVSGNYILHKLLTFEINVQSHLCFIERVDDTSFN